MYLGIVEDIFVYYFSRLYLNEVEVIKYKLVIKIIYLFRER